MLSNFAFNLSLRPYIQADLYKLLLYEEGQCRLTPG